jgi:aminoglycoside phosphotransferase (APT) family kinase protein
MRHRLVVRHPDGRRILLASGGLPQLVTEERHTADVDYINAGVAERFGLRTIVLRSIGHSDVAAGVVDRVHELETLGGTALASPALRWRSVDEVGLLDDALDRDAFARWLRERHLGVVDGREWTSSGWFAQACVWIERALHDRPLEIVQLRSWATSSVLRVRTGGGDCYFKALPESGRVEAALMRHLSQHFSDAVPRIIAAEPDRRWLLMSACRGRKLEEIADVAVWERAAARYARLQVECIDRVDAFTALGCPARDLGDLSRSIEALAADVGALRLGRPDGLTPDEYDRFVGMVPALRRRCDDLAACDIPYSLEHGDLWPGNIFCDATSCAVIDWEDAAVAHPFFSLAPLTVGLMNAGVGAPDNVGRVQRAYAAAFESIAPPVTLRHAIELAVPLCFLEMAARYRHQRPSIVRLHPWMRDLVPQSIRLALSRLH